MTFEEGKKKFIAYARKKGWHWGKAYSDRRAHGRRWKLSNFHYEGSDLHESRGDLVREHFMTCFPGRAFTVHSPYFGWCWVAYESKQSALQSHGTPMMGV